MSAQCALSGPKTATELHTQTLETHTHACTSLIVSQDEVKRLSGSGDSGKERLEPCWVRRKQNTQHVCVRACGSRFWCVCERFKCRYINAVITVQSRLTSNSLSVSVHVRIALLTAAWHNGEVLTQEPSTALRRVNTTLIWDDYCPVSLPTWCVLVTTAMTVHQASFRWQEDC